MGCHVESIDQHVDATGFMGAGVFGTACLVSLSELYSLHPGNTKIVVGESKVCQLPKEKKKSDNRKHRAPACHPYSH